MYTSVKKTISHVNKQNSKLRTSTEYMAHTGIMVSRFTGAMTNPANIGPVHTAVQAYVPRYPSPGGTLCEPRLNRSLIFSLLDRIVQHSKLFCISAIHNGKKRPQHYCYMSSVM